MLCVCFYYRQLFALYETLPEPSVKKMEGVVNTGINIVALVYFSVSNWCSSSSSCQKHDHKNISKSFHLLYPSRSESCNVGVQGWHSGESACLLLLWPGFESQTQCHMWVEFVVVSCPCSEGFSPGFLVFLPPQKPTLQIPTKIDTYPLL